MKYHIEVQAYDKETTTRAMLLGYYGSFNLPKEYEAAAQRGDVVWAIERAAFDSKRGAVSNGFKTKGAADKIARSLRRSIDIGQGMMIGSGILKDRLYDDVKLVQK